MVRVVSRKTQEGLTPTAQQKGPVCSYFLLPCRSGRLLPPGDITAVSLSSRSFFVTKTNLAEVLSFLAEPPRHNFDPYAALDEDVATNFQLVTQL